jgi:hypothetical protein
VANLTSALADNRTLLFLIATSAIAHALLLLWIAWALIKRNGEAPLVKYFRPTFRKFLSPDESKVVRLVAMFTLEAYLLIAIALLVAGPIAIAWRILEPARTSLTVVSSADDLRLRGVQQALQDTRISIDNLADVQRTAARDHAQRMEKEHDEIRDTIKRISVPPEGAVQSSLWTIVGNLLVIGLIAAAAILLTNVGVSLTRRLAGIMDKKWAVGISGAFLLTSSISVPLALHLVKNFDFTLFRFEPKLEQSSGGGDKNQLEREVRLEIISPSGKLDCGPADDFILATFVTKEISKLEKPGQLAKLDKILTSLHTRGLDHQLAALVLIGSADDKSLATPGNDLLAEKRAAWVSKEIAARLTNSLTIGIPKMIIVNAESPYLRLSENDGRKLLRSVQVCALWSLN